jgi:hypothetical protein
MCAAKDRFALVRINPHYHLLVVFNGVTEVAFARLEKLAIYILTLRLGTFHFIGNVFEKTVER